MLDWQPKAPYTAEQLLEILRILRDPENGCPWDKVQTHASIRKNFLEETCEALEAIDADDPQLMQEELGDVLMQVAFHAVIEEERVSFSMIRNCSASATSGIPMASFPSRSAMVLAILQIFQYARIVSPIFSYARLKSSCPP